MNMGSSSLKAG